jgi:hypothetical protein
MALTVAETTLRMETPRQSNADRLIFKGQWGMVMVNAITGGRGSLPKRASCRVRACGGRSEDLRGIGLNLGVFSGGLRRWLRWPRLFLVVAFGCRVRRFGAHTRESFRSSSSGR